MKTPGTSLWRGRLAGSMHPDAHAYLSAWAEDLDLVETDLDVGEAHAVALARAGVFTPEELKKVLRGFERARRAWSGHEAAARAMRDFHDIHPALERDVMRLCGEDVGGRIHLGKSRNDQVMADLLVHTRRRLLGVLHGTAEFHAALVAWAAARGGDLLPAYTHTRPAQPTTAAHWALGHAQAVGRDARRLTAALDGLTRCPLGSAAVAGTGVRLDRALVARLLGFAGPAAHATDATGSRDALVEATGALAIAMTTLSRFAADVIWLSAPETGALRYPDDLADTSSAMPQKQNPDPLELLRGRAASVAGAHAGMLGVARGLPSGYSRDLQEMKPLLWLALGRTEGSAGICARVVAGLTVNTRRSREILERGFTAALDLAEILSLEHGVPFRRAHHAVGRLVARLGGTGRSLGGVSGAEASGVLAAAAGRPVRFTDAAWRKAVDPLEGARRRNIAGGPGDGARLRSTARAADRSLASEVRKRIAAEERSHHAFHALIHRLTR